MNPLYALTYAISDQIAIHAFNRWRRTHKPVWKRIYDRAMSVSHWARLRGMA